MNSLQWPIYVINLVDNSKLPFHTLPPTQHHSLSLETYPLYTFEVVSKLCRVHKIRMSKTAPLPPIATFGFPHRTCHSCTLHLTVYRRFDEGIGHTETHRMDTTTLFHEDRDPQNNNAFLKVRGLRMYIRTILSNHHQFSWTI